MANEQEKKAVKAPIRSAEYIETVYGTRTFSRAIILDDAQGLMDLMDDFAVYNTVGIRLRLSQLEAENKELIDALSKSNSPATKY